MVLMTEHMNRIN